MFFMASRKNWKHKGQITLLFGHSTVFAALSAAINGVLLTDDIYIQTNQANIQATFNDLTTLMQIRVILGNKLYSCRFILWFRLTSWLGPPNISLCLRDLLYFGRYIIKGFVVKCKEVSGEATVQHASRTTGQFLAAPKLHTERVGFLCREIPELVITGTHLTHAMSLNEQTPNSSVNILYR